MARIQSSRNALRSEVSNKLNGKKISPSDVILRSVDKDLGTTEANISNQKVEHLAIYVNGKQILIKSDNHSDYTEIPKKFEKMLNGAIVTHNHPVLENTAIPFSRADLIGLQRHHMGELHAVSKDTVFVFKPKETSPIWKMTEDELWNYMDKSCDHTMNELGFGGKQPAELTPRDFARVFNRMWEEIDSHLEVGYTKNTLTL